MPGRLALKVCPDLLGHLAKDVTTLIVTGTNGKTTTSRMIEQAWIDAGTVSYTHLQQTSKPSPRVSHSG